MAEKGTNDVFDPVVCKPVSTEGSTGRTQVPDSSVRIGTDEYSPMNMPVTSRFCRRETRGM